MRETVDREFAVYVDARQDRWLRGAYLVCADFGRARESVRYAFARLSLRWGREDDPDAYALRVLYERLYRWRPPWTSGPRQGPRGEVVSALAQLTLRQRALVVLSYFEDLTVVEVGELLDRSHMAVRGQLQVALRRFEVELGGTSLRPRDVRHLLEEAVGDVLSPALADEAWATGTAIGRRRQRTAVAVLAVTILLVVAAGLLTGFR